MARKPARSTQPGDRSWNEPGQIFLPDAPRPRGFRSDEDESGPMNGGVDRDAKPMRRSRSQRQAGPGPGGARKVSRDRGDQRGRSRATRGQAPGGQSARSAASASAKAGTRKRKPVASTGMNSGRREADFGDVEHGEGGGKPGRRPRRRGSARRGTRSRSKSGRGGRK